MSFFEKSKILLKKTIHFGVRPTNLTRLTFMLWVEERGCATMRPLCSHISRFGGSNHCLLTALVLIVFVHTIYIFNSDDIVVSFFSMKNWTFIYASNSS